jgi:hypothetical protein
LKRLIEFGVCPKRSRRMAKRKLTIKEMGSRYTFRLVRGVAGEAPDPR